jgi:hypothetical protein
MHQLQTYLCLLSCATASSACFDDPMGHGPRGGDLPDGGLEPDDRGWGTLIFLEMRFLDHPEFGSGPMLHFGPLMPQGVWNDRWSWEEAEGSPFACKVVDRTPEVYFNRGLDIGNVDVSVDLGGPEMPRCKMTPDEKIGWACIGASGSGGDIHVVDAGMGIMSITNPAVTFGDEEVGRVIDIKGASNAANNGPYMVVAVDGSDTIHFKNPAGVEEVGTTAEYATYADRGPMGAEPRISDDAQATYSVTKTDESDFRFPGISDEKVEFGNDFQVDTATEAVLTNFPMDGNEITVGCNGEGGDCGRATASAINIETTDAPIDPDAPSLGMEVGLPPPIAHSWQVFCIFLTGRVVIPKTASEYIANSGATRIRTIFIRAESKAIIQEDATMNIVAGHGIGGFTDLP